jgi:hypothetical protein
MKTVFLTALFLFAAYFLLGNSSSSEGDPVKGMTISCQTWGWEWGTDEMVEAMRELKELGVNWIAIHPYAGIRGDGEVRGFRGRHQEDLTWLTRPIREAHKLGLKICIKPHLAYWRSGFSWRGDISFDTKEAWQTFFSSYSDWLYELVNICIDADAFVVGTELDGTTGFEKEWRQIIEGIRRITDAPITYAANWNGYEKIKFWDDLDVIGIQAYFPISNAPGLADPDQLREGWEKRLAELNTFARKWNKHLVFTELGYDVSENAAYEPWKPGRRTLNAEILQGRCLQTALKAIEQDDMVIGAFIWKWFAGNHRDENFLASTPKVRNIIKSRWASALRSSSY